MSRINALYEELYPAQGDELLFLILKLIYDYKETKSKLNWQSLIISDANLLRLGITIKIGAKNQRPN